jgi:amicyanin
VAEKTNEGAFHRRGILRCVAWVGAGVMLTVAGGVLKGMPIEPAPGAPPGAQVVVATLSVGPATLAVPVGTAVTWTNHDDIPHNVVSPEQKFKSPVLDTDQKYSHTFDVAGTYKYYCSLHPRMTGQVVVR